LSQQSGSIIALATQDLFFISFAAITPCSVRNFTKKVHIALLVAQKLITNNFHSLVLIPRQADKKKGQAFSSCQS
jgi:hypothetical protein